VQRVDILIRTSVCSFLNIRSFATFYKQCKLFNVMILKGYVKNDSDINYPFSKYVLKIGLDPLVQN